MPAQNSFTRLDSAPISSPRARRVSVRALCSRKISTSIHERATRWRTSGSSRRPRRRARLPEEIDRHLVQHLLPPHEGGAALVGERRAGHAPPAVLGADAVFHRHLDRVEEDLVELALARDLTQRADLHALRRHRDREHGDALVRGRVRVGAHQRDRPVGERRVRRPHLLPGHDVDPAPSLGAGRESGEVAPGVGLAEQLAPDVVAGEDPRHPPQPLLLGAVNHEGRTDEADRGPSEEGRCAGPGQLLVVDRELRERRPAPAVLDGPVDADPPTGVERPLPLAQDLGLLGGRRDLGRRRRVLVEPRPQLAAELLVARPRARAARSRAPGATPSRPVRRELGRHGHCLPTVTRPV